MRYIIQINDKKYVQNIDYPDGGHDLCTGYKLSELESDATAYEIEHALIILSQLSLSGTNHVVLKEAKELEPETEPTTLLDVVKLLSELLDGTLLFIGTDLHVEINQALALKDEVIANLPSIDPLLILRQVNESFKITEDKMLVEIAALKVDNTQCVGRIKELKKEFAELRTQNNRLSGNERVVVSQDSEIRELEKRYARQQKLIDDMRNIFLLIEGSIERQFILSGSMKEIMGQILEEVNDETN